MGRLAISAKLRRQDEQNAAKFSGPGHIPDTLAVDLPYNLVR
jgi:hypothetical protein